MNFLRKAVQIYKKEGMFRFLTKSCIYVKGYAKKIPVKDYVKIILEYHYYKAFKSGTFTFRGKSYDYFYHLYNHTWKNERAVEIPVIWDIVKEHKRVLEVGNVLSHYFPIQHTVLDKYEKAPGVINIDVVDFQPDEKYDLIVTISTLEHVGLQEKPQKPRKIMRALENLKRCCTPGGQIVVTLPIGYNREVDRLLQEGKICFTEQYCLKRISRNNRWVEVRYEEIRHAKYNFNSPFPAANAIIIGIIGSKVKDDRNENQCNNFRI